MNADLVRDWHPLDCSTAPDYVPPAWDGPHVGKRLVEGLRTLRQMPRSNGPQQFGNAWPEYTFDWADHLAQLEAEETQRRQDAHVRNWTKVLPTSIEIARMEIAAIWPGRYLREFPQLITAVQCAAVARARHRDLHWVANNLNLPDRLVRRWNREGLDMIAAGLRRDTVIIF